MSEEKTITIAHLIMRLGAGEAIVPGWIPCLHCHHPHYLSRVGGERAFLYAYFICHCGCTAHVLEPDIIAPPPEPCCDIHIHHHHIAFTFPSTGPDRCTVCDSGVDAYSIVAAGRRASTGTAVRVDEPSVAERVADVGRDGSGRIASKFFDQCTPHSCFDHAGPPCGRTCNNPRHYDYNFSNVHIVDPK